MKAYVFPGQGAQFPGMGKDLYEAYPKAKELFDKANEILGFAITEIMFEGTKEELKQTKVTQPAVFLHSVILNEIISKKEKPEMVAGHSLGEFSALVACGGLSFEDALKLVSKRATAMQKACELQDSTMAAVLGASDDIVEGVCKQVREETEGIVVPANYNNPGQIVISGDQVAIKKACELLKKRGARRCLPLPVGGAFHSPLMEPAREELEKAIENTTFHNPFCPIYQNVSTTAVSNPKEIQKNLNMQLTSSVRWTQSIKNMIADGASSFTEVGPGRAVSGMIKKIDRKATINKPEL